MQQFLNKQSANIYTHFQIFINPMCECIRYHKLVGIVKLTLKDFSHFFLCGLPDVYNFQQHVIDTFNGVVSSTTTT